MHPQLSIPNTLNNPPSSVVTPQLLPPNPNPNPRASTPSIHIHTSPARPPSQTTPNAPQPPKALPNQTPHGSSRVNHLLYLGINLDDPPIQIRMLAHQHCAPSSAPTPKPRTVVKQTPKNIGLTFGIPGRGHEKSAAPPPYVSAPSQATTHTHTHTHNPPGLGGKGGLAGGKKKKGKTNSTPLPMGVKKIWATCKPIKKA